MSTMGCLLGSVPRPALGDVVEVQATAEDGGGEEAGLIHNLKDWNFQPRVLPNRRARDRVNLSLC